MHGENSRKQFHGKCVGGKIRQKPESANISSGNGLSNSAGDEPGPRSFPNIARLKPALLEGVLYQPTHCAWFINISKNVIYLNSLDVKYTLLH